MWAKLPSTIIAEWSASLADADLSPEDRTAAAALAAAYLPPPSLDALQRCQEMAGQELMALAKPSAAEHAPQLSADGWGALSCSLAPAVPRRLAVPYPLYWACSVRFGNHHLYGCTAARLVMRALFSAGGPGVSPAVYYADVRAVRDVLSLVAPQFCPFPGETMTGMFRRLLVAVDGVERSPLCDAPLARKIRCFRDIATGRRLPGVPAGMNPIVPAVSRRCERATCAKASVLPRRSFLAPRAR